MRNPAEGFLQGNDVAVEAMLSFKGPQRARGFGEVGTEVALD